MPSIFRLRKAWANHRVSGYFRAAFAASLNGPFVFARRSVNLLDEARPPSTTSVRQQRSIRIQIIAKMVSLEIFSPPVRNEWLLTNRGLAGHRDLQARPLPNISPSQRALSKLTFTISTFFRRNWAMLGVVFAGAFAFELYVAA